MNVFDGVDSEKVTDRVKSSYNILKNVVGVMCLRTDFDS